MIETYFLFAINIFSRGEARFREFDDLAALLKAQEWGMLMGSKIDDFLGLGDGNNLIRLSNGWLGMRQFKVEIEDEFLTLSRFNTRLFSSEIRKRTNGKSSTFYVVDGNGWEYQFHCLRPEDAHRYRQ